MDFTYSYKREKQDHAQKSVVMAPRGMAASSQQLATLAGYKILAKGGNAIDAAVAMVSVQNVVEPHSAGLGGDAFALIYLAKENKLLGMNASGRSAYGANLALMQKNNLQTMPRKGIYSVTVPGALHGWAEAVRLYGKLSLAEVFEDAIYYAENGFPVTQVIAGEWKEVEGKLREDANAAQTYLIDGQAPTPGYFFRNPDLARTYRMIAEQGIEAFYAGEICDAIIKCSDSHNGVLTKKDFVDHSTSWVEPIKTDYRGYTVYELPPNGQGLTALEMLNILEGYDLASMGHNSPQYLHLVAEAKKIAFADRDYHITDPELAQVPVERILSPEYAQHWRSKISLEKAMKTPTPSAYLASSETVYVTAVDDQRNAVSFITSIYEFFGSGIVPAGTGFVLQNRGCSFSLDPTHPNRLDPHKRPMHTIIPAMVFKDGRFVLSFGVMGGDMQPQGHVQYLANLIDFKMNLQEAVDAPRLRHIAGQGVYLEEGIPASTASALQEMGHSIAQPVSKVNQVGGGQAIYLDPEQNVLLGASDRRKDGLALGY